MFKRLSEEDFAVLRGPLESGRQSPHSLAFVLILGIFLQALFFYLTYYIAGKYTIYPNFESIQKIHMRITAVLVLLSVVFAIPAVFKRTEKIQYFLSIVVTQNFAVFVYLSALFFLGEDDDATVEPLVNVTWITLSIGVFVFLATFIRFYLLLQKGYYRKGSKSEELRGKFETTSYIPIAFIGSIGIVFLIQSVMKLGSSGFSDMLFYVFLPLGLFYALLFVLPEQLVILYCKIRFESFQFDERGYLQSANVSGNSRKMK